MLGNGGKLIPLGKGMVFQVWTITCFGAYYNYNYSSEPYPVGGLPQAFKHVYLISRICLLGGGLILQRFFGLTARELIRGSLNKRNCCCDYSIPEGNRPAVNHRRATQSTVTPLGLIRGNLEPVGPNVPHGMQRWPFLTAFGLLFSSPLSFLNLIALVLSSACCTISHRSQDNPGMARASNCHGDYGYF